MSEQTETRTAKSRYLLGGALLISFLLRLGGLSAPFVYPDDWGHSQFLLFARNYVDYGWLLADTIPYFGVAGGSPMVYANHPWLLAPVLSVWSYPFDFSEFSYRSFAIIISLASVAAVFRLGELAHGPQTGVLAALLFGVSPLSIHTGRTTCLELFHICFILWAVVALVRWRSKRGSWVPCAVFLCLAQLSDLFGLFLSGWLFLVASVAALRKERWKPYAGFAFVPIVTQLALATVLIMRRIGEETWSRGAGRVGRPWDDWFQPEYWWHVMEKTGWNYGYMLPVLALVGGLATVGRLRKESDWGFILGFFWFFPLMYTLVGGEWLKRHNHLVIFFGPVLALQVAYILRNQRRSVQFGLLAVHTAISLWIYFSVFHRTLPFHYQEIQFAQSLKQNVREGDLLVGLPPHLIYYTRYEHVVPWNYFLNRELGSSDDALQTLRPLTRGYRRILVFHTFLEWPPGYQAPDFSELFSSDGEYQLENDGRKGTVIWEKR